MKTKVVLASAPQMEMKSSMIPKIMRALFGKPEKTKMGRDGTEELDWNKSSIQCYVYPDGTVGVMITGTDIPSVEFDGVQPSVAYSRIMAWSQKYSKVLTKQRDDIVKQQDKLIAALRVVSPTVAKAKTSKPKK